MSEVPSNPGKPASPARAAHEGRSVLDWARDAGEADHILTDLDGLLRRRRQRRRFIATVAGVALLVGGAMRPWRWIGANPAAGEVVVSRPTTQTLADGTRVELATGAQLAVAFTPERRAVRLSRGTAHFAVAKNPACPFVVETPGVEARAVGTAFAVSVEAETIEVLVTEGRVTVKHRPSPTREPSTELALLDAGRGVAVRLPFGTAGAAMPEVTTLAGDELRRRLDWRVPRLEFFGTPLSRVVAMFNEHAAANEGTLLSLADATLGHLEISGLLRANDTESLLRLLEGEFKISAERQGNTLVLARR